MVYMEAVRMNDNDSTSDRQLLNDVVANPNISRFRNFDEFAEVTETEVSALEAAIPEHRSDAPAPTEGAEEAAEEHRRAQKAGRVFEGVQGAAGRL